MGQKQFEVYGSVKGNYIAVTIGATSSGSAVSAVKAMYPGFCVGYVKTVS